MPFFTSCTDLTRGIHPCFKFLALGQVANGQIVGTTVEIKPFSELSTSTSAKNLATESLKHRIALHLCI
jgi:hypothetical protein